MKNIRVTIFQDHKPAIERVAFVHQRQIAFTHALADKPVLATYSAGPCVIIAGYDDHLQIGFLAHLDSNFSEKDFELLNTNILMLSDGETVNFQIYITGGVETLSESTIAHVHQWLNDFNHGSVSIKFEECKSFSEYMECFNSSCTTSEKSSFLLDTRNGKVTRQFTLPVGACGTFPSLGIDTPLTVSYSSAGMCEQVIETGHGQTLF